VVEAAVETAIAVPGATADTGAENNLTGDGNVVGSSPREGLPQ
jgi:hypothetical protein